MGYKCLNITLSEQFESGFIITLLEIFSPGPGHYEVDLQGMHGRLKLYLKNMLQGLGKL